MPWDPNRFRNVAPGPLSRTTSPSGPNPGLLYYQDAIDQYLNLGSAGNGDIQTTYQMSDGEDRSGRVDNSQAVSQHQHHCPEQNLDLKPLNCSVAGGDEFVFARRNLAIMTDPKAVPVTEVVVSDTEGFRPFYSAPLYGDFSDDMFNTQSADRVVSRMKTTGVLVNANSGELFQTYEEELPPPNRDYSLLPSQLQQTNPYLIQLQGGLDKNRPPRNKQEIAQDVAAINGGNNVWGEQLYADRIRERQTQMAEGDLWRNRNGIYSVEPEMDGVPVGYVGFQPAYRPLPWMPATQRSLAQTSWLPSPSLQVAEGSNVFPQFIEKLPEELENRYRPGILNGFDGNMAGLYEHGRESKVRWKLGTEGTVTAFSASSSVPSGYVVLDLKPKGTLKALMDVSFPTHGAQSQVQSPYVSVLDPSQLRPTLKRLMDQSFSVTGISWEGPTSTGPMAQDLKTDQLQTFRSGYDTSPVFGTQPEVQGPSIRVYEVDIPQTQRSKLEGLGFVGPVYAVNYAGNISILSESELAQTLRSSYDGIMQNRNVNGSGHVNNAGLMMLGVKNKLPVRTAYVNAASGFSGYVSFDSGSVYTTDAPSWTLRDLISGRSLSLPAESQVPSGHVTQGRIQHMTQRGDREVIGLQTPVACNDANGCTRFPQSLGGTQREPKPREQVGYRSLGDSAYVTSRPFDEGPVYDPACGRQQQEHWNVLSLRPTHTTEAAV